MRAMIKWQGGGADYMVLCGCVCVHVSSGKQKKDHRSRVVYTVASHFPLWLSKTFSQRTWLTLRHARTHFGVRVLCNVLLQMCVSASLLIFSQWLKASCTVENHFLQLCLILHNLQKTVTQVHAQHHLRASNINIWWISVMKICETAHQQHQISTTPSDEKTLLSCTDIWKLHVLHHCDASDCIFLLL